MPKVFIDGEVGTTGLGIRERLIRISEIELISLPEILRKDHNARLDAMKMADLVVLCLPDEAAREAASMVAGLGDNAPKLLDASSAHRTLPGWVYGFPELAPGLAVDIAVARKVSNPGCYATGAIALIRPLIKSGVLLADQDVTINAISGYSGGGKSLIAAHELDGGPAFELYGLGLSHKHVPEIMAHTGLNRRPLFVPSVGHFRQGMLVSIPLFLDRLQGHPTPQKITQIYVNAYGTSIRVAAFLGNAIQDLAPQGKNGTDMMELFVCANEQHGHVVLVAQLDNLGKGASGAAVQNIALMLGLPDPNLQLKELVHA